HGLHRRRHLLPRAALERAGALPGRRSRALRREGLRTESGRRLHAAAGAGEEVAFRRDEAAEEILGRNEETLGTAIVPRKGSRLSAGGRRAAVVVDGCRPQFLRSGTELQDLRAYDLGAMAVAALLARSRVDPRLVERVVLGTVVQEPKTSNLAREVALASRLPDSCAAFTVTAACVSS